MVKYTLQDDDSGDLFYTDALRDPMFGTPIFRLSSGTKSSCPYEGGYQRDQPKLKHDGLAGDYLVSGGNPVGNVAFFYLNMCNKSNEVRTYLLNLNDSEGAIVLINGGANGFTKEIQPGACYKVPVSVQMVSPNSPLLAYPNLEFTLSTTCGDGDAISSSVFASVYFGSATATGEIADPANSLQTYPNPSAGLVHIHLTDLYLIQARFGQRRFSTKIAVL